MIPDKALPDPDIPPVPVRMRPLGRFVLPVPEGMELTATWFRINRISVEEIPWRTEPGRRGSLHALRESIGRRTGHVPADRPLPGGWEERDASDLCGVPATLLCTNGRTVDHNIDVHIGTPEVILHLLENRPFDICGECLSLNGPILNLFWHYRFGCEKVSPDSFFLAAGRMEGLNTWSEHVGVSVDRPASEGRPRIHLSFSTHLFARPCDPPRIVEAVKSVTSKYMVDLEVLRSQERSLAGMKGLEEIYVLSPKDENGEKCARLTACWEYQGIGGDPERPHVELKMTCRDDARDDALRMWAAIMTNFDTVRRHLFP